MLRSGLFKTKSEAFRYILSKRVTTADKFPEVSDKVDKLNFKEKSIGRIPMELSGNLKDLLVNRDRFN